MVLVSNPNPYNTYKQQGVMTANPGELIVMLYDGCIKQIKLAGMAIDEKDYATCSHSLIRAQDIIEELIRDLDFKYEISNQLMALYDFLMRSIIDINIKKDKLLIPPIIEILITLRDAWAEVAKKSRITETGAL